MAGESKLTQILSKDEKVINGSTTINGKVIKNNKKLKILGTIWNSNLNWNNHFNEGTNSLIANLTRRSTIVKNAAKQMGENFSRNLAQAIFFGKLFPHIEIIGITSVKIKTLNALRVKSIFNSKTIDSI